MGNILTRKTEKTTEDIYKFDIKVADKIRSIVKDPECGYCRHPEFSESILILKETKKVISSDEEQWYFKDEEYGGWSISEVFITHHLTLDEYIKKYCTFHKFGENDSAILIPVYYKESN